MMSVCFGTEANMAGVVCGEELWEERQLRLLGLLARITGCDIRELALDCHAV